MPRLRGFFSIVGLLVAALALSGAAGAQEDTPRVLAVEFANDINPVTKDYLVDAIEKGERENFDAVVIELDTPGGLDSSMREIIKAQLAADVPVVVYVYPPGARAASAGVFITMAADVAAMAPGTNIGSSTPIAAGGGNIPSDLKRKVVNDAAAYIRALAEEHDRNADWAEKAVRQAANLPAREALALNVVDVIAPDLPTLLNDIDGMRIEPKGLVLHTAGAEIETVRHVALEAHPRHAHRPEHHRPPDVPRASSGSRSRSSTPGSSSPGRSASSPSSSASSASRSCR